MEKKTIGSFIATLRKAKGLTQKQLAEKLCVSDKSISRWERDETMPDLSLIPVIAEIFGVTADELLRGQRKSSEAPAANWEAQTQLQRKRLIKNTMTKYSIRSILSAGIALIGLIAALICNCVFLKSYLGFGLGCGFGVLALMLEVIFTIQAHSSIDDDDLDPELLQHCNNHFFKLCVAVVTVVAVIVAFISPMALWGDPYWGVNNLLDFENIQLCVLTATACLISAWFLAMYLNKKGILHISQRTKKLTNLRLRCIAIALVLCFMFFICISLLEEAVTDRFMTGTTFDNWEDFKTFMEMPSDLESDVCYNEHEDIYFANNEDAAGFEEDIYTEEIIVSEDGTVLCTYVQRNNSIYRIDYNSESDDLLPVTVYTYEDHDAATVHFGPAMYLPFLLICAGTFYYYKKKAAKLRNE